MIKLIATAALLFAVISFSNPASAHAGPSVPTPGEVNFVAHVHGQGFPGSSMSLYYGPYGTKVLLDQYAGLNQQDSNIIYAGYQICSALAGAGANWDTVNSLLGGTYPPKGPQIDAMLGYARSDLGCGR